eukprot:tig00021070_g17864.t1
MERGRSLRPSAGRSLAAMAALFLAVAAFAAPRARAELPFLQETMEEDAMRLLLAGENVKLGLMLHAILSHFGSPTNGAFDLLETRRFVRTLLYLFSLPSFQLRNELAELLLVHNALIGDLVALSEVRATDELLDAFSYNMTRDVNKFLVLFNARSNYTGVPRRRLFELAPQMAYSWYNNFIVAIKTGGADEAVFERLRAHQRFAAEYEGDFVGYGFRLNQFFYAPCIDPDSQAAAKIKVARQTKAIWAGTGISIKSYPDPKRIAVVSGIWIKDSPIHAAYYPFVRALQERFHVRLVQLVESMEILEKKEKVGYDTEGFAEVLYVPIEGGSLQVGQIEYNRFALAYFPDVGTMDGSTVLACTRLAPIMVGSFGQPASAWGTEIDYFVSGTDVEPPGAAAHYGERLLLLPGLGTPLPALFNDPFAPGPGGALPPFVFNCAWNAHKVVYPLLGKLRGVLERARRPVLFRFFAGRMAPHGSFLFVKQMADALGGLGSFELIPNAGHDVYLQLLAQGHAFLDSLPWNGHTTAVHALSMGIPFVTQEGSFAFRHPRTRRCTSTRRTSQQLQAERDELMGQVEAPERGLAARSNEIDRLQKQVEELKAHCQQLQHAAAAAAHVPAQPPTLVVARPPRPPPTPSPTPTPPRTPPPTLPLPAASAPPEEAASARSAPARPQASPLDTAGSYTARSSGSGGGQTAQRTGPLGAVSGTATPKAGAAPSEPDGGLGEAFRCVKSMGGHTGFVLALACSDATETLFSSSQDSTIKVWDLTRCEEVGVLRGHNGFVRCVSVTPDGRYLFSGAQDSTIRMWDTRSNACVKVLQGHQREIYSIAAHNIMIFSGFEDKTVRVWSQSTVFSLAANGRNLFSGSRDHSIKVWDLATLEMRKTLHPPHLDGVNAFALTPTSLFSGSRDKSIKQWDLNGFQATRSHMAAHADWISSLLVAAEPRLLISASRDSTIKVWDLDAPVDVLASLDDHKGAVNSIVLSRNLLLSCSNDRTIKVWEGQ